MEVILGKTAGFCGGVTNAVIKTEKILKEKGSTYCLGELIHNKQEISRLEQIGLKIVENIDDIPQGSRVIFRAHGATKENYEKAEKNNLEVIDLTCPKVLKIHKLIKKYVDENYFIIIIGEKSHPEVIAEYSFAGKNSIIIENEDEIDEVIKKINDNEKIVVLSQTTFSSEKFDIIVNILKEKMNPNTQLEIQKTICDATEKRQQETRDIASKVELMIIIGGKHSANTNKLYEIAMKECNNAMLVEKKEDVYMNYVQRFNKIGVIAGASTPKRIIDEITDMISKAETKGYIEYSGSIKNVT